MDAKETIMRVREWGVDSDETLEGLGRVERLAEFGERVLRILQVFHDPDAISYPGEARQDLFDRIDNSARSLGLLPGGGR